MADANGEAQTVDPDATEVFLPPDSPVVQMVAASPVPTQLPPLIDAPHGPPVYNPVLNNLMGELGSRLVPQREAWSTDNLKQTGVSPSLAGTLMNNLKPGSRTIHGLRRWKPSKGTQTEAFMFGLVKAKDDARRKSESTEPGSGGDDAEKKEDDEEEGDGDDADALALLAALEDAQELVAEEEVVVTLPKPPLARLLSYICGAPGRLRAKLKGLEAGLETLVWALKWMRREYPTDFRKCMVMICPPHHTSLGATWHPLILPVLAPRVR